jgi:UDP-N-acetylmuramoylalanine--D-glutamate ligase
MILNLKSPIAILGFGVEGQYAHDFLVKHGYAEKDITVLDNKKDPDAFKDLSRFATIIRSPGVRLTKEIQEAVDSGAMLTSMTKLTVEVAAPRLTAITGSNGKTTTTALTEQVLRQKYNDSLIVGGNDRTPILDEALSRPANPILIEASSFQFMELKESPHISAILNITPNHMDWHKDLEEYIWAKGNLIRHQKPGDWAILNANNENCARLAFTTKGNLFWIGKKQGDNYAIWEDGFLTIKFGESVETILPSTEIAYKTHPENILFAAVIGKLHNVPSEKIAAGIRAFRPVSQRLEFVRSVEGISFYNDSSCTTPESAEVALDQFPHDKLIMMLGGSSKKADFSSLAEAIKKRGVRAYLYGAEGARIFEALEEAGAKDQVMAYNLSKDFKTVIEDVYKRAKKGDIVVLSPACASFDMFKNSKERGKLFSEIVGALS